MKQFFKIVFGSMLGFILAGVILFFITIGIIGALVSSFGEPEAVEVDRHSILRINLNYNVEDRTETDPAADLNLMNIKFKRTLGLNDILRSIKHAKEDDNIEGIYLQMDLFGPGHATLEEVRDALIDFKESGKFIVAYGVMVGEKHFYLASVADEFYIHPQGFVEFNGLSSQVMFVKDALDRLGVEMQIFYDGKYKSATEPLRLQEMSEANREQVGSYLNSIYTHYVNNIGGSLNKDPEALIEYSSNSVFSDPQDALATGLITGIKYQDEVYDLIRAKLDGEEVEEDVDAEEAEEEVLNFVDIYDYSKVEFKEKNRDYKNRIAVVYAEGEIVDGEGANGEVGGETYMKTLRKLRKDEKVKAVVLRINSPGGSALASDMIWREIMLMKEEKPVIVSMGNLAASGGYYMAAPADKIYAQPTTLTGSIGVFGIVPNMQDLFNDKLGITFDTVKTGQYSDFGNLFRPLADKERERIQQEIHKIYYDFLMKVSEGRNMDTAQVGEIAQGRVWTGLQAKEIGLVDEIGGMEDAIAEAAAMAEVEGYVIREYPIKKDLLQRFIENFSTSMEQKMLNAQLGEYYEYWEKLQKITDRHYIQARMPYDIIIK